MLWLADTLLPPGTPTLVAWAAAVLAAAGWAVVHRLAPRPGRAWPALRFVLGALAGTLALMLAADALRRHLVLASTWPLGAVCAGGALAAETALLFYRLERSIVPRRAGLTLAVLRVLLILAVVVMLWQPVKLFEWTRRVPRHVAVLVDESSSMQIPETGMAPAERLRLAEWLGVDEARRPYRLEESAAEAGRLAQNLALQLDWLAAIAAQDPAARRDRMTREARTLRAAVDEAQKALGAETNRLTRCAADTGIPLDPPGRQALQAASARLTTEVGARLETVRALARPPEGDAATNAVADTRYEQTVEALKQAATALADLQVKVTAAGETLDRLTYEALPAPRRQAVDAIAELPRQALARRLLNHPRASGLGPARTLVETLDKTYGARLYSFAEETTELTLSPPRPSRPEPPTPSPASANPAPSSPSITPPASPPSSPVLHTDLAGALVKAASDTPQDQLAGILVLTDGRHNADRPVEPVARRLGLAHVPVVPVVFGGGPKPPVDAAIVRVEAPDTVFRKDKVYVNVDLKLDGLDGSNATVCLYNGPALVATQRVAAAGDTLRARVQLADEPPTNGLQRYRVEILPFPGEVVATNNAVDVPVMVTEERIRLLVLEGRPRWEFRYLKNLFTGRDSIVQLQHVLFHPDRIDKLPETPSVPASVTRPLAETEATALPERPEDWLKFDVIVLGDVDPADFGTAHLEILRRFLEERGGALIVLAGPQFMPHAFAEGPLAELLPVTVTPSRRPVLASPEPSFRIGLTAEGRQHVAMRLAVEPAENDALWSDVPEIYWRHALRTTKEGARVLAYALPPGFDALYGGRARAVPDEETLRQQHQFERDNALIATHHVARGRVLFLAFDHTWRLRYKVGDKYHHRFWGQVLRWAAPDKLPCGTATVRLGADRPRYTPDESPRVRARVVRADLSPVPDAEVRAVVYGGNRRVLRKRMDLSPEAPGLYAADLGPLPTGVYRVELESAEVDALVPAEERALVAAEFAVAPAVQDELSELTADRGPLGRVAALTAGRVLEPSQIEQALAVLGPPATELRERRQFDLWSSWPWLALILALAAAEWIVRKKVSLP